VDQVQRPVHVVPAEREQLPETQARERGHGEDRGVLFVGRVCCQELDLTGVEHVEVA
jgi:hypothetical protein